MDKESDESSFKNLLKPNEWESLEAIKSHIQGIAQGNNYFINVPDKKFIEPLLDSQYGILLQKLKEMHPRLGERNYFPDPEKINFININFKDIKNTQDLEQVIANFLERLNQQLPSGERDGATQENFKE